MTEHAPDTAYALALDGPAESFVGLAGTPGILIGRIFQFVQYTVQHPVYGSGITVSQGLLNSIRIIA